MSCISNTSIWSTKRDLRWNRDSRCHRCDLLRDSDDRSVFWTDNRDPNGNKLCLLLAYLFLYSYEAEFIQTLIKSGKRHPAKSFRFTYRYIGDVLSINNRKFGGYINIILYPVKLEIKYTIDADHQASYLDLLLKYDNYHRLQVKVYKRDYFYFAIVNFPSSNLATSQNYQLMCVFFLTYSICPCLFSV